MNKAYSNLRHGTERKGRSVILEREIFNLQNKNPWEGLLETLKKIIRKTAKKTTTTTKQQQQQNNNNKNSIKNRKPHAKPSKHINVHIPVLKTLIDPIQSWQVQHTEVSRLFEFSGGA